MKDWLDRRGTGGDDEFVHNSHEELRIKLEEAEKVIEVARKVIKVWDEINSD